MSEILPPEQNSFLLQRLGSAQMAAADLGIAGTEVMEHFGWDLERYGASIQRLVEQRWIKAHLKKAGEGDYVVVIPTEVTAFGWHQIKHLQNEQDPMVE